jgi:hypothetical protein
MFSMVSLKYNRRQTDETANCLSVTTDSPIHTIKKPGQQLVLRILQTLKQIPCSEWRFHHV